MLITLADGTDYYTTVTQVFAITVETNYGVPETKFSDLVEAYFVASTGHYVPEFTVNVRSYIPPLEPTKRR